jgi:hypothetical protein
MVLLSCMLMAPVACMTKLFAVATVVMLLLPLRVMLPPWASASKFLNPVMLTPLATLIFSPLRLNDTGLAGAEMMFPLMLALPVLREPPVSAWISRTALAPTPLTLIVLLGERVKLL